MTGKEAINILKEEKFYLSNHNTNEVLKVIEKELDALEIIKRELIDIVALISSENLFMYNSLKRNIDKITQEEFNLLKEVFKDI